jgi:hypothetical protein
MPVRRFPPPWSAEEQDGCFVVRDDNGQQQRTLRAPRHDAAGGQQALGGRKSCSARMRRGGSRPIQRAKVFAFSAPSHPNADYKILT